jgi:hypothetical protein
MRICFTICVLLSLSSLCAQQDEGAYLKSIAKADSLFNLKEYSNAATLYNSIFNVRNSGRVIDRYNAAICWALSANPDSAFYQLNRIATLGNFGNHEMLLSNSSFESLKNDKRWNPLIKRVKENGIRLSEIENINDIKHNNR